MKERVCACGHELSWHLANARDPKAPRGECNYGHGTAMGGCRCTRFHSRRRGSARPVRPFSEDMTEAVVREVERSPFEPRPVPAFDLMDAAHWAEFVETLRSLAPLVKVLEKVVQAYVRSLPAEPMPRSATMNASSFTSRKVGFEKDRVSSMNGSAHPKRLGGGEKRILAALAQFHPRPLSTKKLALLVGYRQSGGGFRNYMSALRARGVIEGPGDANTLTPLGLEEATGVPPLPTGPELANWWFEKLGKAERTILEAAIAATRPLTKDEVARVTGYSPDAGGFRNALSRLRSFDLIERRGDLRLTEDFRQLLGIGRQ